MKKQARSPGKVSNEKRGNSELFFCEKPAGIKTDMRFYFIRAHKKKQDVKLRKEIKKIKQERESKNSKIPTMKNRVFYFRAFT